MIEKKTPGVIAPPIGKYPHLVRVSGGGDWLFISGQVGLDLDGAMPGDVYTQARNVYRNIELLLESEGLTPASIVRLLTFLVGDDSMGEFARARNEVYERWFPDGDVPGHSLSISSALARPDVLIEIEGWAIAPAEGAAPDDARA